LPLLYGIHLESWCCDNAIAAHPGRSLRATTGPDARRNRPALCTRCRTFARYPPRTLLEAGGRIPGIRYSISVAGLICSHDTGDMMMAIPAALRVRNDSHPGCTAPCCTKSCTSTEGGVLP
jgi:hypothetical protein